MPVRPHGPYCVQAVCRRITVGMSWPTKDERMSKGLPAAPVKPLSAKPAGRGKALAALLRKRG